MNCKNITIAAATIFAASNLSAAFLAGWDFQNTTGAGTPSSLNADTSIGGNDAVLTQGDWIFVNDAGTGNSTISGASDQFWNANGFQGGVPGDNSTGTKSLATGGDGNSFTIQFDASSASGLGLYFFTGVQNIGDYGTNLASTFFINTFTITMDNGVSTSSFTAGNYIGSAYGETSNENIGFLDGASVATLTFEANGNTPAGLVFIDNIGLTGTGTISVVPEPSAFAAIAGGLVLAFLGARRRR